MLVKLGLILVVGFTIVLLFMRFVRPNTLERSIGIDANSTPSMRLYSAPPTTHRL